MNEPLKSDELWEMISDQVTDCITSGRRYTKEKKWNEMKYDIRLGSSTDHDAGGEGMDDLNY